MRARGAVAYGVALVAFLCLGLWLGGHPAKLPEFLRDHFVGAPAGLDRGSGGTDRRQLLPAGRRRPS